MFNELTIAYMFFGGIGSGALIVLLSFQAVAVFRGRKGVFQIRGKCLPSGFQYAKGYFAAFVALACSALCLVFDLPYPNRAYLLFLNPTATSLSIGGFALVASAAISFLLAVHYSLKNIRWVDHFMLPVAFIGIAVSAVTALYPGVLMTMMIRNEVWHTVLVPLLFGLSALSTGAVLVSACFMSPGSRRVLENGASRLLQIDSVLIVLKAVLTALYVAYIAFAMAGTSEIEYLFKGAGFPTFCFGYLLCGLAVPFALERIAVRRPSYCLVLFSSALVLAGGFCLRIAVVGLQL